MIHSDDQYVRDIILKGGLKKEGLSMALGMNKNWLGQILTKPLPWMKAGHIEKLAKELGVTPKQIIMEERTMEARERERRGAVSVPEEPQRARQEMQSDHEDMIITSLVNMTRILSSQIKELTAAVKSLEREPMIPYSLVMNLMEKEDKA